MSRIVIRLDRHVKRQLRCLKNKTRDKGMATRCQIILLVAKGVRRGIIAESLAQPRQLHTKVFFSSN